MATVRDLIPEAQRGRPGFPQGTWFAEVVAPVPLLNTSHVWVIIPDVDPTLKWGPCMWTGNDLPSLGSKALVVFDNRQNPWVMVWP